MSILKGAYPKSADVVRVRKLRRAYSQGKFSCPGSRRAAVRCAHPPIEGTHMKWKFGPPGSSPTRTPKSNRARTREQSAHPSRPYRSIPVPTENAERSLKRRSIRKLNRASGTGLTSPCSAPQWAHDAGHLPSPLLLATFYAPLCLKVRYGSPHRLLSSR